MLAYACDGRDQYRSAICWWTYPRCARTPKLSLQTVFKLARERPPVRVCRLDHVADAQEGGDEGCDLDEALARADPGVLVRREDAQLVVVLVAGFAVVPPVLLVPPVAVRVAELSLNWGRLDVASVLCKRAYPSSASLTGADVLTLNPPRPSSHLLLIPLLCHLASYGSLCRPAFVSVCISVLGLNVPCLDPRHRSDWGRPDISRRGSGCTGVGRSVAGQLGAGEPRQQPLPTAAGTPWLRLGARASGGRSVSQSIGRSVAQLSMELPINLLEERDLPWAWLL